MREALERKIKIEQLEEHVGRVLVPTQREKRIRGGSARVVEDRSRPIGRRILSEATAHTLVDILTEAVERGTGQKAKIPGVKVFGKTGTAQIAEGGVYVHGQWTGSFIGGAPAEAPKVVVLVSIRKPNPEIGYYGGTVAAPAARDIIRQALAFLGPR